MYKTLEPLLHALARTTDHYKKEGQMFNILANADGLALIGSDRKGLKRLLNTTESSQCDWNDLQAGSTEPESKMNRPTCRREPAQKSYNGTTRNVASKL